MQETIINQIYSFLGVLSDPEYEDMFVHFHLES
jgi:hypothetical protein